jgi:hypothetical protein
LTGRLNANTGLLDRPRRAAKMLSSNARQCLGGFHKDTRRQFGPFARATKTPVRAVPARTTKTPVRAAGPARTSKTPVRAAVPARTSKTPVGAAGPARTSKTPVRAAVPGRPGPVIRSNSSEENLTRFDMTDSPFARSGPQVHHDDWSFAARARLVRRLRGSGMNESSEGLEDD